MHRTVFPPGKVPGSQFPNAMRRPVFDDLELIEPKQDLYVLLFIQLKGGNDILEFPVIDEQIRYEENLGVADQVYEQGACAIPTEIPCD